MDQLKTDVMSILMALAEDSDGLPIPRSILYLALGGDLGRYETAERFLVRARMIETTSETVVLTPRGKEAGDLINRELA